MSIGEQITESLGPFARESEDLGEFVEGLTAPIELPYAIIGEENQDYGWSVVLDPDLCPVEALPWLAQFEGVELTEEMTEAQRRAAIRSRDGSARGRLATIVALIERTLTISRRVIVSEQHEGDAYALRIRTLASETPDENLTRAAAVSQKPAGIVLDYDTIVDGSYDELAAEYSTYDDIPNVSYTDLLLSLST